MIKNQLLLSLYSERNKERLAIFKTKTFCIGLALRILLLFIGGSSIFHQLFIPFLDHYAQNPFSNPWTSFSPEYFPYGLFPLFLLGLPKAVLYFLFDTLGNINTLGNTPINYFIIKSVLLLFDLSLFWILSRFTRINNQRLTWFYWLNPIVIYSTFVLGHFDIISIYLIILSLFLIGKNKFVGAGVVTGLALTSKFQVAIVLPFIAAYLWNNNYRGKAIQQILAFLIPTFLMALLGFLPVLVAQHLSYSTLSSPEAQRLFSAKIQMGINVDLLIGVALMLLALGRLIFSTRIRFSGLIFGSGFLLGCLVLTTNALPGWYLWVLPFLALFFTHYVTAPSPIFISMTLLYLIRFCFEKEFNSFFLSLSYTFLQTSLLVQLFILYILNLRYESQLKNRIRPMMIGISGDSGSGKNFLSLALQQLLDPNNCITIEGDNYHKWERGDKNWENLTHLNPNANNLFKLQDHANKISHGQPFLHHHYDHSTGRFIDQPPVNPTKSIIFQGLHTLYPKSLRDQLDLKIFLDPNEKVRDCWKIQRDVFDRGHTLEKVLEALEKRKHDAQLYIQPQKDKSDWIIEITTDEVFDPAQLNKSSQIPFYIKYTLFNDEPVMDLISELQSLGINTTLEFLQTDLDKVIITIKGLPSQEQILTIAEKLFPQMRHITRSAKQPQFLEGIQGIHQLFALALLNKRLES